MSALKFFTARRACSARACSVAVPMLNAVATTNPPLALEADDLRDRLVEVCSAPADHADATQGQRCATWDGSVHQARTALGRPSHDVGSHRLSSQTRSARLTS